MSRSLKKPYIATPAVAWMAVPGVAYAASGSASRPWRQDVFGTQTSSNYYVDGAYLSYSIDASGCGSGIYDFRLQRVRNLLPDATVRSELDVGFCAAARTYFNLPATRGNHHNDTRVKSNPSAGTGSNITSWRD